VITLKAQRLDIEVCDYSGYHSHKIQSLWFIRQKAAMLKAEGRRHKASGEPEGQKAKVGCISLN
jgi:hypothetical protein